MTGLVKKSLARTPVHLYYCLFVLLRTGSVCLTACFDRDCFVCPRVRATPNLRFACLPPSFCLFNHPSPSGQCLFIHVFTSTEEPDPCFFAVLRKLNPRIVFTAILLARLLQKTKKGGAYLFGYPNTTNTQKKHHSASAQKSIAEIPSNAIVLRAPKFKHAAI